MYRHSKTDKRCLFFPNLHALYSYRYQHFSTNTWCQWLWVCQYWVSQKMLWGWQQATLLKYHDKRKKAVMSCQWCRIETLMCWVDSWRKLTEQRTWCGSCDINMHQKVTVTFLYQATWYLWQNDDRKAFQGYCSVFWALLSSKAIKIENKLYNITDD